MKIAILGNMNGKALLIDTDAEITAWTWVPRGISKFFRLNMNFYKQGNKNTSPLLCKKENAHFINFKHHKHTYIRGFHIMPFALITCFLVEEQRPTGKL